MRCPFFECVEMKSQRKQIPETSHDYNFEGNLIKKHSTNKFNYHLSDNFQSGHQENY